MPADICHVARFRDLPAPPWPWWETSMVPRKGDPLFPSLVWKFSFLMFPDGRFDFWQEWSYLRGGLTTLDRDYGWINNIHHDIGTHVIHHLFPQIPHYHLIEAVSKMIPPVAILNSLWGSVLEETNCMFRFGCCRLKQRNQFSGSTTGSLRDRVRCRSTWLGLWSRAWTKTITLVILGMLFIIKPTPSIVALPVLKSERGRVNNPIRGLNQHGKAYRVVTDISNSFRQVLIPQSSMTAKDQIQEGRHSSEAGSNKKNSLFVK